VLKRILLVFSCVIILAAGVLAYLIFGAVEVPAPGTATIVVKKGANLAEIADDLHSQGLVRSRPLFRLLARAGGVDRRIKPGRYDFTGQVSTYRILRDLYEQNALMIGITFPEGWWVKHFAALLEHKAGVPYDRFMELCRDSVFLAEHGVTAGNAQGYLMPASYRFYWGLEPEEIIGELLDATDRMFDDSLKARMAELDLSEHEVLTLASLIEAEVAVAEERPRVSAVFHNRLKKGYKLQCDPTVIYALGGIDRKLLRRDLEIDSPYNTYKYYGLPPGPINNPGRPSVIAALYPLDTDELYFVARGDGTHIFSKTLAEHNRARQLARRLQRGGS
jgi:UPF0755 protein